MAGIQDSEILVRIAALFIDIFGVTDINTRGNFSMKDSQDVKSFIIV